jgi:putative intracellular protease/amidase
MRLSILIYDGVTTLDAVGGYEVLARIPGIETEFVALTRGVIAADTRRLGLLAYRSFDEVRSTDILYVPGGPGGRALETDSQFLDYLRVLDRTSTWTIGICNGVTLLAAAGLLKGYKATTNWFDRERIAQYGVEFVAKRYHMMGKYVTGAGVSASIDTALFFAKHIANEDVARAIQLGLEYYPEPPLTEKTPDETPSYIHQIVRDHAATEARILQTRPVFADAPLPR